MRYARMFALIVAAFAGCATPGDPLDRTQTNLVDKSIFQGEWWYNRTVIALEDDAAWALSGAGAGAPWPGATANYDLASRSDVNVGRIRWVIDENFLFAYRSHELVFGAADNGSDPTYLGQPLAVFPITAHVDVRREYDSLTGEPTNVTSESTQRRWYDRQYVRVDWSQNLVHFGVFEGSLDLNGLFGQFNRESVGNWVQQGGDARIPDSWRPQFVRVGEDPSYRLADEWPAEFAETVHYMSFVTNELWTPTTCLDNTCLSSIRISLRHAFLRIPPDHEYAVETLPNSEYDRFGIIRTDHRTYVRGGRDRSTLAIHCDAACNAPCDVLDCNTGSDCGDGGECVSGRCIAGTYTNPEQCGAGGMCRQSRNAQWGELSGTCSAGEAEDADDCGVGSMCNYGTNTCAGNLDADCGPGLCNTATNICDGGLTPELGERDFLAYYRLRHNFYRNSFWRDGNGATRACVADWQCDGRYDAAGENPGVGSTCDVHARVCTLPIRDREIRPVSYRLSAHYPRQLIRSSMEVTAQWNEAFMRGNRELKGEAIPTGNRVACQAGDPTAYCFCGSEVVAPEVNPAGSDDGFEDMTCAHQTNFFVRPADRGETNPYDCWVGIVEADGTERVETEAENPSNPTSYDDYEDSVYRYAFIGGECMLKLETNSCDRAPASPDELPAACEELGDLRYQFFNYISAAGAGFCGVMQQVADPLTGEAVAVPINMSGLCYDTIATAPVYMWPVLRGEIDEDVVFTGDHVRGYFERLGHVRNPIGLAPAGDGHPESNDPSRPAIPVDLNGNLNAAFARMNPYLQQFGSEREARPQLHSDRLRLLEGTDIERRLAQASGAENLGLVERNDILTALDMNHRGQSTPSADDLLDRTSPLRQNFDDLILADRRREMILAENHMCFTDERALYVSRYSQYYADAFRGRSIEEAALRWGQLNHRSVMLHEMGHGLGLEHNFAASFDRDNYAPGYFGLVTQTDEAGNHPYALPTTSEFDEGRDGLGPRDPGYPGPDATEQDSVLTGPEAERFADALRQARTERTRRGIGNYMTSSLMDYNGDYSDNYGLGFYDRAAVYFNYFNMVETYEGDPRYREGASTSLNGLLRSDITPRRLWTWYRGGEACQVDSDCPYAGDTDSDGDGVIDSASGLAPGQRVYQRCIRNPRYSDLPAMCAGDRNCMCSGFDDDMIDFTAPGTYPGYQSDRDNNGVSDFDRVTYMFCGNPRTGDISWCSMFDAGESFQEVIDHYRQRWQEGYPSTYFRNARRGFTSGSRATGSIVDAAKIYQHLFFRYNYEPDFRAETGALGFNDQFLASVDAMNWLAELAQLPEVGSYRAQLIEGPAACDPRNPDAPGNPAGCQYGWEHMGQDIDMTGSEFSLRPGESFYHWSRFQDGLQGFFRMDRAGVFWDKLIALRALTVRDWGLSFTVDERYFINFYDLFPKEMAEIFGGLILNDPRWMAPRVEMAGGTPQVSYLNFLHTSIFGNCRSATTGEISACDVPVAQRFPQMPVLGTSNEILRLYAAIFALAEFPAFFNPSFESKLAVFKLDNADGFRIPDVQLDGQPTQAFGSAVPGSGHTVTSDPLEADYIIYESERLHTQYVATKIQEDLQFNLEEEQLGFQLLLRLSRLQQQVRALEALGGGISDDQREELNRTRQELQSGESFLESLIEVQRIFGITSWL